MNWRASCSGDAVKVLCATHVTCECDVFTKNFVVRPLVLDRYVAELSAVPSEIMSPKLDVLYRKLCGWCEEQPYGPCVLFSHGICSG